MALSHWKRRYFLHTKKIIQLFFSDFLKCESLETHTWIKKVVLEQFRRGFFCPGNLSKSLYPCKFRLLLSNFSHKMLVLGHGTHFFIWLPGHLHSFAIADLIQSSELFLLSLFFNYAVICQLPYFTASLIHTVHATP